MCSFLTNSIFKYRNRFRIAQNYKMLGEVVDDIFLNNTKMKVKKTNKNITQIVLILKKCLTQITLNVDYFILYFLLQFFKFVAGCIQFYNEEKREIAKKKISCHEINISTTNPNPNIDQFYTHKISIRIFTSHKSSDQYVLGTSLIKYFCELNFDAFYSFIVFNSFIFAVYFPLRVFFLMKKTPSFCVIELIHHFFFIFVKNYIKKIETMTTLGNEKQTLTQLTLVGFIFLSFRKLIDGYMILTNLLSIMLDFFLFFYSIIINTFVVIYDLTQATNLLLFDKFCTSFKFIKIFDEHTICVHSIDYLACDDGQFICSGSDDKTIRVWDIETNKQTQLINGHSGSVFCVKFSQYHYHSNRHNVICSSSSDSTIRFWDFKDNKQLKLFSEHNTVFNIEFSSFNGGRYLCSGSRDETIRLWDVETSKSLHTFYGHTNAVRCVDFSPLQSNNNESNSVGVIGGNGYTICSGSFDNTIRIWDIETNKQFVIFKGHGHHVNSVKYGLNKLGTNGCANTILSGSKDKSVRLWDRRSGHQIQIFNGHTLYVTCVEYSPFVVDSIDVGDSSSVICSGSLDNTIRFWDIRSNKEELHVIKGDDDTYNTISCFKFLNVKVSKVLTVKLLISICRFKSNYVKLLLLKHNNYRKKYKIFFGLILFFRKKHLLFIIYRPKNKNIFNLGTFQCVTHTDVHISFALCYHDFVVRESEEELSAIKMEKKKTEQILFFDRNFFKKQKNQTDFLLYYEFRLFFLFLTITF
ncbi:hypothetical protein RFI_02781 [Reticulomyxa filosa]|uniref:Uncharacterized protein n=1 Tax=Reticulomyxa filosa TaxID=46433 RepID=X6P870_RETFI|nr:hypothetical protein RFI_02781 [Reticulomyxa filosa]|eukprot:ETO34313.1 hypothetical protein RFI_02781 [Reticulomyxa filosa]